MQQHCHIKVNTSVTPCDKSVAETATKMSPIYNSINNKENINNTLVLFIAHDTTTKKATKKAKILLAEIDSLDNGNGCYASNEYFAKFFDLTVRRIQQCFKHLTEIGYISISTDAITKQRYIKINSHFTPCEENFAEKTKEISPIYNSINNKENINNTNVLFMPHEMTTKKTTKKAKVFSECLSLINYR